MNLANYLFVFYIFALIAMLIYIWTKASKGKLDERIRQLEEKQRELIVLQNDTKDAIMVFETYMYETKENLETERSKIEYLISKFEDMLAERQDLEEKDEASNVQSETLAETTKKSPAEKKEEKNKDDLYEEISKLSKKGYSLDEIVKKLGISKGEANFILGITK